MIQPRPGGPPVVELRQWREGTSQLFDARANLGAGVTTLTGIEGLEALGAEPPDSPGPPDPSGAARVS
jgi:hypothetical protein